MSRRRPIKPKTKQQSVRADLIIEALGHRGDGVGFYQGRKIYIPFVLPGETVSVDIVGERGKLVDIHARALERTTPPCPHFGVCGGCSLQHFAHKPYLVWKQKQVEKSLKAENICHKPCATHALSPYTRRRATFSASRDKDGVRFGFQSKHSNRIIPIKTCPVLVPDILNAFEALKGLAKHAAPTRGMLKIFVQALPAGLDVRLDGVAERRALSLEYDLVMLCHQAGFARLSLGDNVLLEQRKIVIAFGSALSELPPGAFIQACEPSQRILISHALKHLQGAAFIVDLFAGCGTFALNLATHARIHAVEQDNAALSCLQKAARTTKSLRTVTTERRDLFHRPLQPGELARFDGVVLDPPRAGAKAQSAALARSSVKKIAYISCSPASFARDAKLLLEGGYRLVDIFPVDQFLFSHHIELVGCFEKD